MFTVHTATLDGLISGSRFTPALAASRPQWESDRNGPRFARHLLIDVEPNGDRWAIVFRSADKVRPGGKSAARDPQDRKYHRPPAYYTDEAGKPRRFILATTDEPDTAESVAAAVLAFWTSPRGSFFARWDALSKQARLIVLGLLPIFGASGPCGRIGTFHRTTARSKRVKRRGVTAPPDPSAQRLALRIVREKVADSAPPPEVQAEIDGLLTALALE